MTIANFSVPSLHQNQSQKEIIINEGFQIITSFMNKVVSQTLGQLPEQTENGYLVLISDNPEEGLVKYINNLAIFINNTWHFSPPHEGLILFNLEIKKFMVFRKGIWEKLTEVM